MTSQPPLLDQTGSSLPGPQFSHRPGWGGQLKQWTSENIYRVVFRTVLLCALILIVRSLWMSLPVGDRSSLTAPTATPSPVHGIALITQRGDGMTHLAARALDLFVAVQSHVIRLDAAQHLFAVDTLARATCWCTLTVGQEVTFSLDALSSTIDQALTLSPAQHRAWSRLLR